VAHELLFGGQIDEGRSPVGIFENLGVVGLFRQERRYNIIANNLSNVQTVGYKRDVPVFYKALSKSMYNLSNPDVDSSYTVFQQGELQPTGNKLDLAIEGEGFFKVKTPAGIRYTRSGNFHLNRDRVLVTAGGFPVMGRGNEICLRGENISIQPDGTISVDGTVADKIEIVTFADLRGLRKEGGSLFTLDQPQEEKEPSQSRIHQGSLEASNVNMMEEMIQMIDSLRWFESCHRLVQAQDEMKAKAINEMGKL